MIESEVEQKRWKPFPITKQGPFLSHIFFADDLILFGQSDAANVRNIMRCLNRFCDMSGQRVNTAKSRILFSRNTYGATREAICQATSIQETEDIGKYLGVPLHTKRVTKAMYHDLIAKVSNKLSKWKAENLSLAGRRVLIQSTSSTIANHVMQSTLLPKNVSREIDKHNRNFLWRGNQDTRKTALVKWSDVCLPKEGGGLGLRKTEIANKAYLAKLGWNILTKKETLWADIMRHKYLRAQPFMEVAARPENSYTWKGILATRDILGEGLGKRVCDGKSTLFWLDRWAGTRPLALETIEPVPPTELLSKVADYWTGT